LLKDNQFYRYESGKLKVIDGEINYTGLTKLSLLAAALDNNVKSSEHLPVVLSEEVRSKILFRRVIDGNVVVWELFSSEKILKKLIINEITDTQYDYILWPKEHLESPKLLVFDMDSTFIKIEVIDELAKRHGVGDTVSAVTEAAMRGELDFSESLISRVKCLKGLNQSNIDDICKTLPLSSGVKELVSESKFVKIAIVSGGFSPFVEYLKDSLSLYKVKANHLEVKDDELTGKVLGKIVDASEKAVFIKKLQKELKLEKNDIMAIGDGANDLLMMEEAGFSLAYRAKPAVQEKAKGRMNHTDLNHLLNIFNL